MSAGWLGLDRSNVWVPGMCTSQLLRQVINSCTFFKVLRPVTTSLDMDAMPAAGRKPRARSPASGGRSRMHAAAMGRLPSSQFKHQRPRDTHLVAGRPAAAR
jgi:hypothetical protein